MRSETTADSLMPAVLQELLQSLHDLSPLMGQLGAGSRKVPQLADRLRGDERGPYQAVGAELGQPGRIRDVGLAAGQILHLPGVDQDDVQLFGQQVVEGLPVVAGRLDHHQGDLGAEEVFAQVEDGVGGGAEGRGLVREGSLAAGAGGAYAHLGVPLADVDAGAAFVQDVHGLGSVPVRFLGCVAPLREGQGSAKSLTRVLVATLHGSRGRPSVPCCRASSKASQSHRSRPERTVPRSIRERLQGRADKRSAGVRRRIYCAPGARRSRAGLLSGILVFPGARA